MSDEAREIAAELEPLLPEALRALFSLGADDPLPDTTVAQLRLLRQLQQGTSTVGVLSEKLNMSPSAISQVVNRLEAACLIERTDDESDRRVKHLRLTFEGAAKLQLRQQSRVQKATYVLAQVPLEDRAILLNVLRQIVDIDSSHRSGGGDVNPASQSEDQRR
jgi:MarR family transcriptional regulator, transcriptional regulator for hemolysin